MVHTDIDTDVKFKAGGVDQKVSTPGSVGVYVLRRLSVLTACCKPQRTASLLPLTPPCDAFACGSHFRPLAQQVVIHIEQEDLFPVAKAGLSD